MGSNSLGSSSLPGRVRARTETTRTRLAGLAGYHEIPYYDSDTPDFPPLPGRTAAATLLQASPDGAASPHEGRTIEIVRFIRPPGSLNSAPMSESLSPLCRRARPAPAGWQVARLPAKQYRDRGYIRRESCFYYVLRLISGHSDLGPCDSARPGPVGLKVH